MNFIELKESIISQEKLENAPGTITSDKDNIDKLNPEQNSEIGKYFNAMQKKNNEINVLNEIIKLLINF